MATSPANKPVITIRSRDLLAGIANSPHLGFGLIKNIDLEYVEGVIRANISPTKVSSTTVTGQMANFCYDNVGNMYGTDSAGKVYKSTNNGGTWSDITGGGMGATDCGRGIIFWKDYVITCGTTQMAAYGPISGSPSWVITGWTPDSLALTTAENHKMVIGPNDILYIANQRYVASLKEDTNFDPTSTGSYTFNNQALDLREDFEITTMDFLGDLLNVFAYLPPSSGIGDLKSGQIFPWDTLSDSFTTPIQMRGVRKIASCLSVGGLMYFITEDEEGAIYAFNGREVGLLRRFLFLTLATGETSKFYFGGIMLMRDKIFFGLGNSSANGTYSVGVYSYDIKTGRVILENLISTGADGSASKVVISALLATGGSNYIIAWNVSDTTYGIDKVAGTARATSYAASAESPFFRVAIKKEPFTFRRVEIELARDLVSGEGVKIEYRARKNDSWTTVATIDYATYGGINNIGLDFSARVENVQFRISLTTSGLVTTSPELIEVNFF